MSQSPDIVAVQICGQSYPIRSSLDARYVAQLARYVDDKMRTASESTPTTDATRLAVLAALNIADELFRCQEHQEQGQGALAERTQRIEQMVDEALRLVGD